MGSDGHGARIAVIGQGYVGLVAAACFAKMGNTVVGVEVNAAHLEDLRARHIPFFEPGLEGLIAEQAAAGRLLFARDPAEGVAGAQFVFVAVGTPKHASGQADLSQIESAARQFAGALEPDAVVVLKSTVPVRTAERVRDIIRDLRGPEFRASVVSNPEFLQQGRAIESFLHPDRIVLGGDPDATRRVAGLYASIEAPILETDHATAAMIKYASNAILATRISFVNEMAKLCDAVGVDFLTVARGMGMDRRINPLFMSPGPGFGGSCFPKDVSALVAMGQAVGVDMILLKEVLRVNHRQPRYVYDKLRARVGDVKGRAIALFGLSFKAETDDVRESPAIDLARILLSEGAQVRAYDPRAEEKGALILPSVRYSPDPYEAAAGAAAAVICTEWPEFRNLDLDRLHRSLTHAVLIDARNLLDPESAAGHGFRYTGIGRGSDPVT